MYRYVIRRLLVLPFLLVGISLMIFAMMQFLSPYQRVSLYVSDIPKGQGGIDALVRKYGLDRPVYEQYLNWTNNVIHGDLGYSTRGHQPVVDAIRHLFPATLELALWSAIPIIWVGIKLGVISATHQNKFIDQITRIVSIVGWSFPTFVFGLLMLMIFYARLDWFPAGRLSEWASQITSSGAFNSYTGMNTVDALLNGRPDIFFDAVRHLVLPAVTLSYLDWALMLRVTRSSMLETLRQDYVTTARAKGLTEHDVVNRHAKPNAMIPVATIGGLTLITLLNGVVITETIFNYRGMGWFFADAAVHLDVIAILGFTMFNAIILVLGNLVVDVLYGFLDPRVRLA
jgi:peptide/nickel transport system permease protein